MDRPNLHLAVVQVGGLAHKLAYLTEVLPRLPAPGLLYCATREHTELVAGFLRGRGLDVAAYHAGMEPEDKRRLQGEFLAGRYRAIAATNALGMGIDKSDLRYVIHVDVPGSITAYYQEVGRAGRDGRPARGILLYDPQDRRIQEHFILSAQPRPEDFEAVLEACEAGGQGGEALGLLALKARSGLHPTRATVVVAELVEQGYLEKRAAGGKQVYVRTRRRGKPELDRYVRQLEVRTRELDAMLRYGALEAGCLMAALRSALGDAAAAACGRCSVCRGQSSAVDLRSAAPEAERWLADRPAVIAASKRPEMDEGLALLDAELRGALLGELLHGRSTAAVLPEALEALLRRRLDELAQRVAFGAVVAVPSRTWTQREAAARLAARTLDVPVYMDLLVWRHPPEARQGELLNNDQRRQNVDGRMGLGGTDALLRDAVLLLDDYTGSGATLREAARVLRKEAKFTGPIVPLTLARVRWRLGARGMALGALG
jgi:ATP-dependent DNA helicase RecQ